MQEMPQKKVPVLKKIVNVFIPPDAWKVPVIILLGIFAGLGVYILFISNAVSYLSDNPETCVNCHVMNPQFATWQNSSHARAATCNDCHVPHNNFIRKYFFKASDGLRHATIFTFRLEPQVITIKEAGAGVVQENCIRCHYFRVQNVYARNITYKDYVKGDGPVCWSCHRETPHGRVRGLASAPYARVPNLSPVVPEWLENPAPEKGRKQWNSERSNLKSK